MAVIGSGGLDPRSLVSYLKHCFLSYDDDDDDDGGGDDGGDDDDNDDDDDVIGSGGVDP